MTSNDVETFVKTWVAENVQAIQGTEDLPREVGRLAAKMTGDARMHGIGGNDLAKSVGDIDDFLTAEYAKIGA
ncbi:MAG: hypothetical protein WDN03_10135 [Rhizomicrobium sp.]